MNNECNLQKNVFLKLIRVKKNRKSTIFFFAYFVILYIGTFKSKERETSTKKYKKIINVPDLFGSGPKLM